MNRYILVGRDLNASSQKKSYLTTENKHNYMDKNLCTWKSFVLNSRLNQ